MPMGPFFVNETLDTGIVLKDGIRLSARTWIPEGSEQQPVPAILEYLPYRKRDGTCARDALTHPYFASHGYACLRVDMRGNGDSEGLMHDEYAPQELSDALEVIDWIASQPWCTGKVGMMGISWGGFNSLQVAALDPEPLKSIITLCSTVDRFADDIHYKGGCLLNENLGWAGTMLSYSSRPPDPALVGERWREMWLERLENEPHLAELWASHQHRNDYWKHGSVCEDYDAITAAVLAVGGWGDSYKNAVPALVENLSAPAKGILGPWVHKYPHFAVPEPRIGFLQEALRWWDRWLKDIDTGVENDPGLRVFVQDSEPPKAMFTHRAGRWAAHDRKSSETLTLELGPDGLGDGGEFEAVVDSPADVGMASGEYCAIWLGPELPSDQRRDDALSTTFDTKPLDADVEISGAPEVTLTIASDQPVAQVAVRLNDVRPDGTVARVTYGVLNLCHRDSAEHPKPMPVGEPVTVSFKLDHTAYKVPAGHRLRLSISNAYWPLLWPSPTKTKLKLTAGKMAVPLLSETSEMNPFEPPEAAPPWQTRVIREPGNKRDFIFDQHSGMTHLEIVDDFGEEEDLDHGLVIGSIAREWWSIHPDVPLSADGRTHWTKTLSRGDWSIRTETFSAMTSDETTFTLTARIEAYEGGNLVFEKDLEKTIPRDLV